MKIDENWAVDMYLNVCVCNEFLSSQKWQKNEILDFSGTTCASLGYFIQYFVCKCSFRKILTIKMVILYQSKPISLYLKIKKSKIQKSQICKLHVYYS